MGKIENYSNFSKCKDRKIFRNDKKIYRDDNSNRSIRRLTCFNIISPTHPYFTIDDDKSNLLNTNTDRT